MNPTDPERPSAAHDFERQAAEQSPGLVGEFLLFLRHSKKWWLLPIVLLLLGLTLFLVLGGTAAAPWLYTLF